MHTNAFPHYTATQTPKLRACTSTEHLQIPLKGNVPDVCSHPCSRVAVKPPRRVAMAIAQAMDLTAGAG